MYRFEDAYDDITIISGRMTLWTLHQISSGNNTRTGLDTVCRSNFGLRDVTKVLGLLMDHKFIRPQIDVNGLTRFYVNGERMADIAAFISGLGAKPVETVATTCTVETVAREVKALENS